MKSLSFLIAFGLAGWLLPSRQSPAPVAPAIPGVVAAGTRVEFVGEFPSTEGPIAAPDGGLLFNAGDRIMRIEEDGRVSVFLETGGSLAFDQTGRLLATQRGTIRVIHPRGAETVLADSYSGRPLLQPNDLVADRKGGIYFTDPGPIPGKRGEPRRTAVYYLRPNGSVLLLADDLARPNGIQLSPDERVLYVDDTWGEFVFAFDVQADGSVRNRRRFARLEGMTTLETGVFKGAEGLLADPDTGLRSGADGLAIDAAGRLYVAADAGVQVFSPKGDRLGILPIPRPPQNLAFAGPDKRTLYVVGRGAVYRVRMLAQGYRGRAK